MQSGFFNPETAFGGTQPLLGLIESIYGTVLDATLWPSVAAQIATAMKGEAVMFFSQVPESPAPCLVALTGMSGEAWGQYSSYYRSTNPIKRLRQALPPPSGAWYSHQLLSEPELEATECYNDFFRPNGAYYFAGMELPLPGLPPAVFSCHRAKSGGEFDQTVDLVCQVLKPHLQRALALHLQFGRIATQSAGWQAALGALDQAVFGLDAEGRVGRSNACAEALAREEGDLRIVHQRLHSTTPRCDRRLQPLLAETVAAGAGAGFSSGGSVALERRSGKPPLRLTATPFVGERVLGTSHIAALVFVSDPASKPLSRASALRTLYQLTPTEAKVADLLFAGMETREVAPRLGVTYETCRIHIKHVLGKTGVMRQSALIRLMASLPGSQA